MISSRYALMVALLLALALIPTVIHSYFILLVSDGKLVGNISHSFDHFSSKPSNLYRDKRIKKVFASEDWIERIYVNSSGTEVLLFVARSYDFKRLYHHPELALSSGIEFISKDILIPLANPEMPIHLLRNPRGRDLVAYVLLHDGKFIKDPLIYQFHNAFKQIFSPRKAMTLFYVSGSTDGADFSETSAAFILGEAVKSFQTSIVSLVEVE